MPVNSLSLGYLVLSTAVYLSIIKLVGFLLPGRYYFSFTSFLFENRQFGDMAAAYIKLAIPLVVAFGLSFSQLWLREYAPATVSGRPRFRGLTEQQVSPTLAAGAALAAFLLAWPYILLWDLLIDPKLNNYRLVFYFSYLAYVVAYYFTAKAGAELAIVLRNPGRVTNSWSITEILQHPTARPIDAIVSGVSSAAVSYLLVRWLS